MHCNLIATEWVQEMILARSIRLAASSTDILLTSCLALLVYLHYAYAMICHQPALLGCMHDADAA